MAKLRKRRVVLGLSQSEYLVEQETFDWKFCDDSIPYTITNGTLKETIHLKLYDSPDCTGKYTTDYQLQLIHTSNNQTSLPLHYLKR